MTWKIPVLFFALWMLTGSLLLSRVEYVGSRKPPLIERIIVTLAGMFMGPIFFIMFLIKGRK